MALNGLFCADVPLRNYSITCPLFLKVKTQDIIFFESKVNTFNAALKCSNAYHATLYNAHMDAHVVNLYQQH